MHPVVENFVERPLSQQIMIWVGSIAVIGLLWWVYFYSPKLEEFTKLEEDRDRLETQVSHEQRLARNLPRFRKEVKELDIKLKGALKELPDKKEIPDLLTKVSRLARDAGLEVQLFKPKPVAIREFYEEVPVDIAVQGGFHQVATFFDEVGHLSRIVNIQKIAMDEPKVSDESVQVTVNCNATTFRYLQDHERVQNKKKKGKKRRR